MYNQGWVTGTGDVLDAKCCELIDQLTIHSGGGISIKLDDEIYIAPSGVQKERMQVDDMFIQNMVSQIIIGLKAKILNLLL